MLIGLGLGVAGCAGPAVAPPAAPPGQVTIAPDTILSLPSPASLHRTTEAQQLVVAHYSGRTFVFQTSLSVTPSRVLVVGTDTMGRRALTITWNGHAMQVQAAPWVPAGLRPSNVIADIILLHWPVAVLRAHLAPPATMRVPRPNERVIMHGGQEMIRMRQDAGTPGSWSGRWTYRNIGWGYGLEIQSAAVTP